MGAETVSLKEIARQAALRAGARSDLRDAPRTNWNKRKAAARLQISYKALLYKIKDCDSPIAASPRAPARSRPSLSSRRRPARASDHGHVAVAVAVAVNVDVDVSGAVDVDVSVDVNGDGDVAV